MKVRDRLESLKKSRTATFINLRVTLYDEDYVMIYDNPDRNNDI